MSPQIHLPLKALATKVTAKRLEARVFPTVSDEIGALTERFAADLTLVRLFSYNQKRGEK